MKNKSKNVILSLLLLTCASISFAQEGNGKGNGKEDPCRQSNGQQCRHHQQQQQQQQQQRQNQVSAEELCQRTATLFGWKEETASFVCAQAKYPVLPVLCVTYAQYTSGWPTDGSDWPYTGLICRAAPSSVEPIECAKKVRARGWSWALTVEACQGAASADVRLKCIDQHLSEGSMSWEQVVSACRAGSDRVEE